MSRIARGGHNGARDLRDFLAGTELALVTRVALERLLSPLRIGALAAAVVASLASGPAFEPPAPDSCLSGATGSISSLEVSGPDETTFTPLADDDVLPFVTGGQGVAMVGVRFRLVGTDVPSCASHETELSLCSMDGDCSSGAVFGAETVPLSTYAEDDGSRTTKPLWLLLDYSYPNPGEQFVLRATVAGADIERTLWFAYRGLDSGPDAGAWGDADAAPSEPDADAAPSESDADAAPSEPDADAAPSEPDAGAME